MKRFIRTIACTVVSAVMAMALLTACGGSSAPAAPSGNGNGGSTSTTPSASSSTPTGNSGTSTASSTKPEEALKPLKIESSNYYSLRDDDSYNVYYSFVVTNPNPNHDFKYIKAEYSIKDEEGKVLEASFTYIPPIAAGDTITFGGHIWINNGKPASVNFQIDTSVSNAKIKDDTKYAKQSDLKVFNTSRIGSDSSKWVNYTGEITNTSKVNIGHVDVQVFYLKNGKLLAGESTTVFDLNAGQTKAFKITTSLEPSDYDSYQIIAVQDSN